MATITNLVGIDEDKIEKLRAAGIRTTEALLGSANTAKRREQLVANAKVGAKQLADWVNQADLMRVKGISGPTAALLEKAGINSVRELRAADAKELAVAMDKKLRAMKNKIVQRAPSASVVQKWIDSAKELKLVVRS